VAKNDVKMHASIPAADIINGNKKLYPVLNSGDVAEMT